MSLTNRLKRIHDRVCLGEPCAGCAMNSCAVWSALWEAHSVGMDSGYEGAARWVEHHAKCYPGSGMVTLERATRAIRALIAEERAG